MGEAEVTNYFISNLPYGCTPWEVKYVLGGFGEVAGVYIAKKNDKFGCRFGFISFKRVRDVRALEQRLNGTKMGRNILRVNVARFADENVGLDSLFDNKGETQHVNKNKQVPSNTMVNENLKSRLRGKSSYKDTLENKGKIDNRDEEVEGLESKSKVVLVSEETQAFKELFGRALVGRSLNLESLIKLDSLLLEAGFVISEKMLRFKGFV